MVEKAGKWPAECRKRRNNYWLIWHGRLS